MLPSSRTWFPSPVLTYAWYGRRPLISVLGDGPGALKFGQVLSRWLVLLPTYPVVRKMLAGNARCRSKLHWTTVLALLSGVNSSTLVRAAAVPWPGKGLSNVRICEPGVNMRVLTV